MKFLFGIALALGIAAAAYSAAALITLTGPGGVGAGDADVTSCDATASASVQVAYDASIPGYEVASVTVSDIDDTACEDAVITVQLTTTGNAAYGTAGTATVVSGTTSYPISFAAQNLAASGLTDVHVAITGP